MKSWLLFLIFTLTLVGCRLNATPPTPIPTVTPPPINTATATLIARPTDTPRPSATPLPTVTLTPAITTLILWESLPQNQTDKLREALSTFSQLYPHTVIETQHYDDPETIAAAIIDGRVDFDLILGPSVLLSPLQRAGKLQPVDEFFPADYLDGFVANALQGARANDRLWGLPDSAGFHLLLYYNLDLIEQPPTTDLELISLTQKAKTDTRWGLVLNSQDPLWLLPWLWAYGGQLTDDDGRPSLNLEPLTQTLTQYLSWHQGQKAIAPVVSHVEAQNLFLNSRAAMLIDGDWAIDVLAQNAKIPWAVATLPNLSDADRIPAPVILARYWGVSATTTGPHAEAAIAFLEYISLPDRQLAWAFDFGLLPTQRAALTHRQLLNDSALRISARQLQTGQGLPLHTNLNAILDAMRPPLAQMLSGQIPPEEAAAQIIENLPKK